MNPKRSDTDLPIWMGRYPRKGADWTPDEDRALLRAYESGRYLTGELAMRHLREPVAIERRLDLLRKRAHDSRFTETRIPLDKLAAIRPERNWQTERETAQQAVSKIKGLFAAKMWPGLPGKKHEPELVMTMDRAHVRPGEIVGIYVSVSESPGYPALFYGVLLTDLPPEVAQALQFGGES